MAPNAARQTFPNQNHSGGPPSVVAQQKRDTRGKPRTEKCTFHKGLDSPVHAVLKVLQHQDDLVVAFVGHNSSDSTDLQVGERKTQSKVLVSQKCLSPKCQAFEKCNPFIMQI